MEQTIKNDETLKSSYIFLNKPNQPHLDLNLSNCKVFVSNNDKNPYLDAYHDGQSLRFLIDIGASVSLLKSNKNSKFNNKIDITDKITLNGLSPNAPMETIGSCTVKLKIKKKRFSIKFYVITENSNVPFNGIIGNDFLSNQGAIIDLNQLELKLNCLTNPIKIFRDYSNKCDNDSFIIDPRSETIIEIDVLNKNISEGICPDIKITDGVYLAKALLKINNGKALTTILNTQNKSLKINKIKLFLEPFDKPNAILINDCKTKVNVADRIKLLGNNLRLEHLNFEEKQSTLRICNEYHDIFHLPNDPLTYTNLLKHEIKVTDPNPIMSKIYRFPEIHKKELDRQISKMITQGIIRESVSPYNSPLWIVPKKLDASGERKWRIVVDYRKLNDVTVFHSFPLPSIESILDQLGHSKYFTTLDLASGFHQILMHENDIPKTAFSTPTGHYEYIRMPFGLKNAPSTFQRLMNTALTGLHGFQCFVYLDDIVIFASTIEEHYKKLKNIFDRLRSNKLLLQPDKCEFMRTEVAYLGHVISEKGVSPNPNKIISIKDYPKPNTPKQIKQFLDLIGYYRRFIQDFSK